MGVRPRDCRASVIAVRTLAPDVIEADLRMEDPLELEFEAGQWVSVPLGPRIVRPYSIASTPSSPRVITLTADVAPGGPGSVWFGGLAPGVAVHFKGPLGSFVFDRSDPRQPLLAAEEIGIVPIRSILNDLFETGADGSLELVYWAGQPAGLVYDREFRALAGRGGALAYHPVVDEAPGEWTGERGALVDLVDRLMPSMENRVVYVAGSGRTIHLVRDRLVARGLPRKAVKWEKFW